MYLNERKGVYPLSMVNITNKCNLKCEHCFIYRDGTPHKKKTEMDDEEMLDNLRSLQKQHQIKSMVWMGGEPLLRPGVLRKGMGIFEENTIDFKRFLFLPSGNSVQE